MDAGLLEAIMANGTDRLRDYVARRNPAPQTISDLEYETTGWTPPAWRTVPSGPDVEGLSPDEAARMRAMWARQVEGKEPTARTDVTALPAPLYSGTAQEAKGTIKRGLSSPEELSRGTRVDDPEYPLLSRPGAAKRPSLKSSGVEEADPVVGQRRVSLEGLGLEKIYKLQTDLNAAKDRLSRQLDEMPPDSPKAKAIGLEMDRISSSASDMARLARSIGTVQGKQFEKGAPESYSLLGTKPASYPETEAAARTIEEYQRTGKMPGKEQIAQMKRDIAKGLTAGTDQHKALVKQVGKAKVATLTKKRDALLKTTSLAESAVAKDTGQAVTQDMVQNPQGYNLGPHALRALNNARKNTLAFDAELAKIATSSALRMTQAARQVQGPRGKLKTIRTVTPKEGVKIERVEQLIERAGGETAKPSPSRGRFRTGDRTTQQMLNRINRHYNKGIIQDQNARTKNIKWVRPGRDPFWTITNPTKGEIIAMTHGLFGTKKGEGPTEEQRNAGMTALTANRGRYNTLKEKTLLKQSGFKTKEDIKAAKREQQRVSNFERKLRYQARNHKNATMRQLFAAELSYRNQAKSEGIKLGTRFESKQVLDKYGDIVELERIIQETPSAALRKALKEPEPEPPPPAGDTTEEGAAPKADLKLADVVLVVEKAIPVLTLEGGEKESRAAYIGRVKKLWKKVKAIGTPEALDAAAKLRVKMNTAMPEG
tara:strand:+ start:3177 stop:5312 length:2136 start_codon:yes stop_codon:yes gene_type:complete